jgi:hypothetical protein
LIGGNLSTQIKAEWVGGWHMITIILFSTTYVLIIHGLGKVKPYHLPIMNYIGFLYIGFSLLFIISSIYFRLLAPQWIILLPIGILVLIGSSKQISPKNETN